MNGNGNRLVLFRNVQAVAQEGPKGALNSIVAFVAEQREPDKHKEKKESPLHN